MWIRSLAFVAWALVFVSEVSGQEPDDSRGWCFRGRPLEACKAFWITEFSTALPLGNRRTLENTLFTWELGAMANVTRRSALGGALFMSVDGWQGLRLGVRPRYRRWLSSTLTLDLAAGLYKEMERNSGLRPTGQIALGVRDQLAITAQVDAFGSQQCVVGRDPVTRRYRCLSRETTTEVEWYLGVKLGSGAGIAAGLLAPVAYAVAVMIACSAGCGFGS
jgi:hypothetical protein